MVSCGLACLNCLHSLYPMSLCAPQCLTERAKICPDNGCLIFKEGDSVVSFFLWNISFCKLFSLTNEETAGERYFITGNHRLQEKQRAVEKKPAGAAGL